MRPAVRFASTAGQPSPRLIEGYAAIFDRPDLSGDVIRAGAFGRSLRTGVPPMLLQHQAGAFVGRWVRITETGHGLLVRGLVENEAAERLIGQGLNGLSIGFRPRVWTERVTGGRLLADIDLVEVSLVSEPMQPAARFELM